MFFQFSSEVTGLARYAEKSDVEFGFDSPRVISVRLSKGYPDGLKPHESADAVCTSAAHCRALDRSRTNSKPGGCCRWLTGR